MIERLETSIALNVVDFAEMQNKQRHNNILCAPEDMCMYKCTLACKYTSDMTTRARVLLQFQYPH